MNSLNSILLDGELDRVPELKKAHNGTKICTFTVKSVRWIQDPNGKLDPEYSYFEVESWAALADRCAYELTEGRGIRVVGRLKQNLTFHEDGTKTEKVIIIAEHVDFKPVLSTVPEGQDRESYTDDQDRESYSD